MVPYVPKYYSLLVHINPKIVFQSKDPHMGPLEHTTLET